MVERAERIEKRSKADCLTLRVECDKRLNEMKDDIRLIKSALVGTDMRGGLVNQVLVLTDKLNDLITSRQISDKITADDKVAAKLDTNRAKDKRDEKIIRYKLLLISAVATILGVVLGHLLDFIR